MRTSEEVREEAEIILNNIIIEMNAMYNNIVTANKNDLKILFSKSFILLLYAHYEGFSNTILQIYLQHLNLKSLKRKEAKDVLIASSMDKIFQDYEKLDKKNGYFKKDFPEESHLHKFYRREDFLNQINNFLEEKLVLPDKVISTESNLSVKVLEKNLYKLGIPLFLEENDKIIITRLLMMRNDIAHTGSHRLLLQDIEKMENEIRSIKDSIINLLNNLILKIYNALKNEEYKK